MLVRGPFHLGCYKSGDAACAPIIEAGPFRVIAIDGPIVPKGGNDPWIPRGVERLFASGLFQRRCKPGASHVSGTGRQFREAACTAADRLAASAPHGEMRPLLPLVRAGSVVETFPNTFLGVCLSDKSFREMPRLRRGRKFDWLYDEWVHHELVKSLPLPDVSGQLSQRFACTRDHDERAALVCLMAALLVANGTFLAVGDPVGGWFFLPPFRAWQPWARDELVKGCQQLNRKGVMVRVEEVSVPYS